MTTQDYLDQLESDRSDMVDNLETQGITGLTGDETFTELVPEILNITTSGGIYHTTSIQERDLLSASDGDICLVMTDSSPSEYLGLYKYSNSTWVGLDLGDDVTTADIISGKKAAKNTGLITGAFPDYTSKNDARALIGFTLNKIVLPADASGYFRDLAFTKFGYKVNASSATNISNLFSGCNSVSTLDLSDWTWSSLIVTMGSAFVSMSALKYLDISGMKLSTSLNPYNTAYGCFPSSLETLIWKNGSLGNSQFMNTTMFSNLSNLKYIDLTNNNGTPGYNRWSALFSGCNKIETIILKNFKFYGMASNENPGGFLNKTYLKKVDLSGAYFSQTGLMYMLNFSGCTALEDLNLNFSSTLSPRSMSSSFSGCSSLVSINLNKVGFTRLTSLSSTFYNCSSLKTISNLNKAIPTTLTTINSVFYGCSSLESLDLSTWDTTNVTDMGDLFKNCSSLSSLDIRNFVFDSVTTSSGMFSGIPAGCLIIVKDTTEKDWVLGVRSDLTNVQTVAEYEASQSS